MSLQSVPAPHTTTQGGVSWVGGCVPRVHKLRERFQESQRAAVLAVSPVGTRGTRLDAGPPSSSLTLVQYVRHRDCGIGGTGGPLSKTLATANCGR
jgi:hypothetical protein